MLNTRPWTSADAVDLAFAPGIRMRLQPGDVGHESIWLNGFYERQLSRQIVQLARAGGILVDVGANYGYFSLLWLAQNPGNRCIAFEPAPDNTGPLAANIERNGLSERITFESVALSDQCGVVPFTLEKEAGQTGWGGIAPGWSPETLHIPAVTLDAYWAQQGANRDIDVLKIDVEGADTLVLQGARGLLAAHRIRHIFFEVNLPRMKRLGIVENQAQTLLTTLGYRIKSIAPNEMHAFL